MAEKLVSGRTRRDFRAFDANGGAIVPTFNFWGFLFGNLWLFTKGLTGRLFLNVVFLALPFGLWIWQSYVPLDADTILLVVEISVVLILIVQHVTIANRGNYYLYVREGHHLEARERANGSATSASSAVRASNATGSNGVQPADPSTPSAKSVVPDSGGTSSPPATIDGASTANTNESPELLALAEEFRDGLITRAVYEAERVRILQELARPEVVLLADDDGNEADELPEAR